MRLETLRWRTVILYAILVFLPAITVDAQETQTDVEKLQREVRELRQKVRELQWQIQTLQQDDIHAFQEEDSSFVPHRFIHRLGIEARPQYVFPTNPFLKGENERWMPIQSSFSAHLKYSFKFRPNTCADRIYGGAYQGVGISITTFGDKKQLGDPFSFYLFQGARIARIVPRLSLNYEWNFGLSAGWKPYDNNYNSYNGAVGSRMNAYINAGIYLNWAFSRYFDLIVGGDFTHFSNGNTKFPNAGINTTGAKLGIVYNFNREESDLTRSLYQPAIPPFPRHISYDLVLFGSWRRKGVYVDENRQVASPGSYPVFGFNFAPMYNLGYKFRVGASLDGVYDGSANVYTEDLISEYGGSASGRQFLTPGIQHQLALGLSGRAEYVMPYFTIGVGMGTNIIGRGDLRGFYQILALKIGITRSSFLHIGYNLQNFKTPNYLMLGLGFRFNNKYPKVRH